MLDSHDLNDHHNIIFWGIITIIILLGFLTGGVMIKLHQVNDKVDKITHHLNINER